MSTTGIHAEEAALYLAGDHEAAQASVATAIHVYCSTPAWKFRSRSLIHGSSPSFSYSLSSNHTCRLSLCRRSPRIG